MSWSSKTEVNPLSINGSSSHSKSGAGAWSDSITIVAMVLGVYSVGRELSSIQAVYYSGFSRVTEFVVVSM